MRLLCFILIMVALIDAKGQDSALVLPPKHSTRVLELSVFTVLAIAKPKITNASLIFMSVPCFAGPQAKLPFFCSLEDRFWRKVGFGYTFRLQERPLGR